MSLQEASNYRRNKQYNSAIRIYQEQWEDNSDQFNEWDGWSYAFSLKEMRRFKEALEVCRQIYPRYKDSTFIQNLYAQCIYYTQIKVKNPPDLAVQKKAVRAMIDLAPPHQEYSLSGIAIFQLCKNLMKLAPVPWQEIESWIDVMDPDLLSSSTFSFRNSRGKVVEYASQQEEWYSIKIRVKGGLNQPEALLKVLNEARKKGFQWHYQNDIWMERKKAFALKELGENEKAEKILRKILRKKKDWFLYADLGDVLTDQQEQLKTYCQAALIKGKPEMKVKLYEKIAKCIKTEEENKEPYKKHLLLIARIRMENGWSLSDKLEKSLEEEAVDLGEVNHYMEAVKQLRPFWQKYSGVEGRMMTGEIKFIHKNEKSGMITGKDGKDYFFGMQVIEGGKKNAKKDVKVVFEVVEGYDKKRQRPSKMAVNVKVR